MIAEPMPAAVGGGLAVVAQQDDPPGAKVQAEVQRLKARVMARGKECRVGFQALDLPPAQQPDSGKRVERLQVALQADLQAFERRRAFVVDPPAGVAGIEGVGPGGEAPGVVDGDDPGAASAEVDVGCGEAGPAGEADDGCPGPEALGSPEVGGGRLTTPSRSRLGTNSSGTSIVCPDRTRPKVTPRRANGRTPVTVTSITARWC